MTEFTAILRGVSFRPVEAKAVVNDLVEGDVLILQREPFNPYDENAIMVVHPESELHIGYVAKEVATDIAPLMDSGAFFNCTVSSNMMRSVMLDITQVIETTVESGA